MTANRALFFLGRHPDAGPVGVLSARETGGTPDTGLDPWSLSVVPAARTVLTATSDQAYLRAVPRMLTGWDAAGFGWAQTAADAERLVGDRCPDPDGHYDDARYDRCFDHAYSFDGGHVLWWHAGRWHHTAPPSRPTHTPRPWVT